MMGSGALPSARRFAVYPGPRVMFLGDSITFGSASTATGGYRGLLCQLMPGLRPIGTQTTPLISPYLGVTGYDQHEGHGGQDSIFITANIASYIALVGAPDVVLYCIGMNDFFGENPGQVPSNMNATFAILQAANPKVQMLMACPQTPPVSTDNTRYPYWLSGQAPLAAAIAATPGIIQCPVGAQFTDADIADGIHPNLSGYTKMAAAWSSTLCGLNIGL
jgi:lysophospholipase L1-like esterase